ncbi:MAG TPA: hypothetical protein VII43_07345 [Opitutaceae bacterium]
MKTKAFALVVVLLAAGGSAFAATAPTVEFKGSFIKITAGDSYATDEPIERMPPQLLYVRKASILSVSLTFVARSSAYDVVIATSNPDNEAHAADARSVVTYGTKSYFYRFSSGSAATSFCEAILSSQDG